ncbi:MAG: hypothetical protein ACKVJA_03050 [Flavobacteriales bacterium]
MKNIYKYLLLPFFLVAFLSSCNNKKNSDSIKETITLREGVLYKLDFRSAQYLKITYGGYSRPENTEVNWSAYKTNDKTPVSGSFSEFSSDRENQSFNSIDDLVDGLNFSISSLSSSSGDPLRDLNLKDYFFKFLTDNFEIKGTLGRPTNDSIDIIFDVLGQKKSIRFGFYTYTVPSCPYDDQIISIRGKINLINQFDEIAYNSLHARCIDLHKGADGISKTWEEVDVHIKALVINETNPIYYD